MRQGKVIVRKKRSRYNRYTNRVRLDVNIVQGKPRHARRELPGNSRSGMMDRVGSAGGATLHCDLGSALQGKPPRYLVAEKDRVRWRVKKNEPQAQPVKPSYRQCLALKGLSSSKNPTVAAAQVRRTG